MKTRVGWWWGIKLALGIISTAGAQGIAQWDFGPRPPLHPTVIEGNYKGKALPIISVVNEVPEVEVDGKKKRLPQGAKTKYTPQRGAVYAPGSVALRSMRVNSTKTNLVLMFSDGGEVSGGTLSAQSDFSATVIPTQDYQDCYVALIFFDQNYIKGLVDNPGASVQFEAIKPLLAGKENKIKLSFGFLDFGSRQTGFFPLFFTRGMEIRSDQCELIARFFRRREMTIHDHFVRSYREKNPTQSLALQPYVQIPPVLPDVLSPHTPHSVKTSFMVSEEGTVESLQIEEALPADVSASLRRSMSGWLFLPRLKEGRPVRTMVRLPIVLQPTASQSPVASPGS